MAGVREALHSCGSLRAGPWAGLPPHPPQGPLQGVQGGSLSIRVKDRCKVSKVGQGSLSIHVLSIHVKDRCKVSKVGQGSFAHSLKDRCKVSKVGQGSFVHSLKDRCKVSKVG